MPLDIRNAQVVTVLPGLLNYALCHFLVGATVLLFGIAYVTGPTSWSGLLAATVSILGSGLAVAVLSSGRVGLASFVIVGSVWTAGLVMVMADVPPTLVPLDGEDGG